ncbi:MAG: hypothetical protein CVU44_10775 [Chloroflexi bacterium HGW-Chloroflexi-6]|nr:MAG: hypothetical protein CVU44_10775 [Chloroflexi bacterium HGW-Chloroflexi-6]
MTSPTQTTFWRSILSFTALLAVLAIFDTFQLAEKLQVNPFSSKSVLGMLAFFTLTVLLSGAALALTLSGYRQKTFSTLEVSTRLAGWLRFAAIPAFLAILLAFPLLYALPEFRQLFGGNGIRFFIFWLLALAGMNSLKTARPTLDFPAVLAATLILQSVVNLAASYLPAITDYPFAMGWSETSRFYFPSLFFSEKIYGQSYPWPILHPSLHLLLAPPYWFEAPLWFHRAWQVGIRFLMVGLISPALLSRFGRTRRGGLYWLAFAWIFVYLFNLPLYLHLPLTVFPLLWLFRAEDDRRTWILLILTSIWAGLSRLNWYPMPGLILAALYLLEERRKTKETISSLSSFFSYFWKPVAWVFAGTSLAYTVSQVYISLSGNLPGDFFTSISSDLLWYRLWPNETYPLGVLAGILLFSLPLWILIAVERTNIFRGWSEHREIFHSVALFAILLVLFIGGIFVSMKIGGGADLHNMDAYAVLLLIVAAYSFFRAEKPIPWQVVALLVLVPAWFAQQPNSGVARYDKAASQATLTAIQQRVDASEGEILFITQRHLIAMKMLTGVTLIPEYEREDLMEMAMANNVAYLERFEQDIASQRFSAIIVDPLKFNLLGSDYAMGEENNAWARRVVKPVLCWYREDETFPADRVVIYVPREEGRQCP